MNRRAVYCHRDASRMSAPLSPVPSTFYMALPTLRIIGFILGIFLITLAVSMVIPMLTLLAYERTDDLQAFIWGSLITFSCGFASSPGQAGQYPPAPARHVLPDDHQLGGGLLLRRAAADADPAHQLFGCLLRDHVGHHHHRRDGALGLTARRPAC